MKRFISIILSSIMIFASLCIITGARPYVDDTFVVGDASGDKSVNAIDLNLLKKYISGYDDNAVNEEASDIDADGTVTAKDILYIKGEVSGNIDLSKDFDTSYAIYSMTISAIDISNYVIKIPENSTTETAVYTAAYNLQDAISDATGIDLEIISTNTENKNVIEFHVVDIGTTINGYGIDSIEDYYYTVSNGRLDIYGSKYRGLIYASYEIIQDYLKYIYYSKGSPMAFKQRTVSIDFGTESYHSMNDSFSYRFVLQDTFDPSSRAGAQNYYLPQRCNGQQIGAYSQDKYGTLTGPLGINAHSFESYAQMSSGELPDEETLAALVEKETNRYISSGKEVDTAKITRHVSLRYKLDSGSNPNKYNDWQPCMTAKSTYDSLFSGLLEYIEMLQTERTNFNILRCDLGNSFASFSISDNGSYCTCRTCKAAATGTTAKLSATKYEEFAKYTGTITATSTKGQYKFGKESYSGLSVNMANMCAKDLQEYYPGMKVYMILYDHTIPESIIPDENVVIMICGHPCANHKLTEVCTGEVYLGGNNETFKTTIKEWVRLADINGALIYFWDYPIENGYALSDTPNILNLYYDYKWLYEAGVDGIYYEGESSGTLEYSFERAKAYMATKMLWEPTMSYDKYVKYLKEYLYVLYGPGYEYIYEYILMDDAGGSANPCFQNNHDRPFDEHNVAYLRDHYEEMRELCVNAYNLAKTKEQEKYCRYILMITDFLGLSASYHAMYTNGTEESRKLYEERYTDMYKYMESINVWVWDSDDAVYVLPDEIDFTINPMIQFYTMASWRYGNSCLVY